MDYKEQKKKKKKDKEEEDLIWRTGAYSGNFGDPFIADTELEGGQISPSIKTLCNIVEHVLVKRKSDLPLLTTEDVVIVRTVMKDMRKSADIAESKPELTKFVPWLQTFVADLKKLKKGERAVIPGGWMKPGGGHAIMHVAEKETDDSFAFVTNNTGAGIQYHPSTDADYPKRKHITSIRIPSIPSQLFFDEAVWYMFWKIQVTAKPENDASIVYEVILPHLCGERPLHVAVEESGDKNGTFETVQRAGTCYHKSLLACIRYLLKSDGISKNKIKQLFYVIRLGFLDQIQTSLELVQDRKQHNNTEFTESDLKMIQMGCNQTALAAIKMNKRDALSVEGLRNCSAFIENIMTAATNLYRKHASKADSAPYLQNFNPSTLFFPFSGFDLVADGKDTSIFVGDQTEANPDMFVDLVEKHNPGNLSGIIQIILNCHDRCNRLRAKTGVAAPSVVLHQISVLIEETFTSVLPLPKPFRKENKECVYSSSSCTLQDQRNVLSSLVELAFHYVASTFSCQHDRALEAQRSVTTSCLMIIFDAIARKDCGSVLAKVLTGETKKDYSTFDLKGEQKQAKGFWFCYNPFGPAKTVKLMDRYMLYTPAFLTARDAVLSYFTESDSSAATMIFDMTPEGSSGGLFDQNKKTFSMPENSMTLKFVQHLLDELQMSMEIPKESTSGRERGRGGAHNPDAMSPVERLTRWMCVSTWEKLPEFLQYRDMIFIQRLMLSPTSAFIEANSAFKEIALWYTSAVRPSWAFWETDQQQKVAGVRLTMADHQHKLKLDVAPLSSPIDLKILMGKNGVTEEEVLQKTKLPNFNNVLSSEESEQLFIYLTAPFVAIPLVLEFFADNRVGLLLNADLQNLLESVIFEPRNWISAQASAAVKIVEIPVPRKGRGTNFLGTQHGVLMQELTTSPAAVLTPLVNLLNSAYELCIGDFQSSFTSVILFILRTVVRIQSFCKFIQSNSKSGPISPVLTQIETFLAERGYFLLRKWLLESEEQGDLEKAIEFHAHLSLIANLKTLQTTSYEEISSFICSSSYVVSWHSKNAGKTVESKQKKRRPRGFGDLFGGGAEAAPSIALPLLKVPVHDIFALLQHNRPMIMEWLTSNPDKVESLLGRIVSVALQKSTLDHKEVAQADESSTLGWRSVDEQKLNCSYGIESEHPYKPSTDYFENVSFPGAKYISIYFDIETSTEEGADYITLYKDSTCKDHWGAEQKMSGKGTKGWPGAAGNELDCHFCDILKRYGAVGRPPLVIPSDTFTFHFHSDSSVQDWGFKLLAIAPVNQDAAKKLTQVQDKTGRPYSLLAAQHALAASMNRIEDAKKWLVGHADEIPKLEAKGAGQGTKNRGLYQDPLGSVQVNLQTAEVYVNNRQLMPVPQDIASHTDFRAVFGDRSLFCAVVSNHVNRRVVNIMDASRVYEVAGWTPYFERVIATPGVESKSETKKEASEQPVTCINMPQRITEGFLFRGVKYSPYISGTLGSSSSLLDPLLDEAIEAAEMSEKPQLFVAESSKKVETKSSDSYLNQMKELKSRLDDDDDDAVESKVAKDAVTSSLTPPLAATFLMFVPPQGSLEESKGHTGGWFEIQILANNRALFVYALIEGGRRYSRSLVFSSDSRFALSDQTPRVQERETPFIPNCRHAAGNMFETVLQEDGKIASKPGVGNRSDEVLGSIMIKRTRLNPNADKQDDSNVENLREEETELYIPELRLRGLVPNALFERYSFWKTGPQTIRGYPRNEQDETSILCLLKLYVIFKSSSSTYGAIEVSPSDTCAVVKTKALEELKKLGFVASNFERDYQGRLLKDSATVADAGVMEVDCFIKRLTAVAGKETQPRVTLLNALRAFPGSGARKGVDTSSLYYLSSLLSRVDSLSHVLVWSKTDATNIGEEAEISLVELPRLKARFALDHSSATPRLISLDYDGFYIDQQALNKSLQQLVHNIPHSLLLTNSKEERQLLVPNYGLLRVKIKNQPFSTELVYDKTQNWKDHVRTRFYLYPIHSSNTFFSMPSLSAGFYLVVLRILCREYLLASRILTTCFSDISFNAEEKYCINMVKHTIDDSHPDAHALRLRVALICKECSEQVPWDEQKDQDGYLKKHNHVSAECRLTLAEEQDMQQDITRMQYLTALSIPDRSTTPPVELKFPGRPVASGGYKWSNVLKVVSGLLQQLQQGFRMVCRYSEPAFISGNQCATMLEDYFDEDDFMGLRQKKGFAFLYQLLTGSLHLSILTDDSVKLQERVKNEVKNPTQKKAAPAAENVNETYNCRACTIKNSKSAPACTMCSTPNPYLAKAKAQATGKERDIKPSNVTLTKFLIQSLFLKLTKGGDSPPAMGDQICLALLVPLLHAVQVAAKTGFKADPSADFPAFPYKNNAQALEDGVTNQHSEQFGIFFKELGAAGLA